MCPPTLHGQPIICYGQMDQGRQKVNPFAHRCNYSFKKLLGKGQFVFRIPGTRCAAARGWRTLSGACRQRVCGTGTPPQTTAWAREGDNVRYMRPPSASDMWWNCIGEAPFTKSMAAAIAQRDGRGVDRQEHILTYMYTCTPITHAEAPTYCSAWRTKH